MPRNPIHPGEILADELDALSMSGAELARTIGLICNPCMNWIWLKLGRGQGFWILCP